MSFPLSNYYMPDRTSVMDLFSRHPLVAESVCGVSWGVGGGVGVGDGGGGVS